jgi:hypothetical protein
MDQSELNITMLETIQDLSATCAQAAAAIIAVAETPIQREAAAVAVTAIESQQRIINTLMEQHLELGEMFDELIAKTKLLLATL